MAVVDISQYPVVGLVKSLLNGQRDDERDYIQRAFDVTTEERGKGAKAYMNACLYALYGSDTEERASVVARLSLGGEAEQVELTDKQKMMVASILMETYKKRHGD